MSSTGSIPKQTSSLPSSNYGAGHTIGDPIVPWQADSTVLTTSQHSDLPQAGSPNRPIADQGNSVRTQWTQLKGDGAVAGTQKESRTNGACAEGSGSGRGGRGGGEQARGGGGDARGHRRTRRMFMASELTLVENGGPSVGDRLQPMLEAAEKALIPAMSTVKAYRWALNIITATLVAMTAVAYVVAATVPTTGRQMRTSLAIFAGVLFFVSFCLLVAWYPGIDMLGRSLLRICELEEIIRELKTFMLEHQYHTLSMVGPEVEARMARHKQRLDRIIHPLHVRGP